MRLVKETSFIPILSQPQINQFAHVVSNKDKSLSLAFCLSGSDANHFGKDLEFQIFDWQVENAQQLHHLLLDLIQYCRLQKLQIKFALCFIKDEQLILASLNGKILLKRANDSRVILESKNEINMIVGHLKSNDQLILVTNDNLDYASEILELMKIGYHQEKLISEITVQVSKEEDLVSIAFVECQEKQKINLKKELKYKSSSLLKQIYVFLKETPKNIKKILKKIREIVGKIKKLSKKQRQKITVLVLIVALLISSSIGAIAFQKNRQTILLANTQEEIQNLSQTLNSIEEQLESNPLTVRQETELLINNLKTLREEKKDRASKKLIEENIAQYESLSAAINSENNLDKLTVFSDWHSQYPDFLGQNIKIDQKARLYVINSEKNQLLRIDGGQIANQQLDPIRDFSPAQIEEETEQMYLLNEGIFRTEWAGADIKQLKEEGESDRGAELLTVYGPYIYLLNREKRNIYRYYDRQEDGLSEPIGWLVDKEGVNFQLINDLAIDGDLWIAFSNGQLLKFSRGYQEDFAVQGLSENFNQPLLVASQENSEKIAVLEKKNRRLVILTKDGQVISEIKSNELAGVADIEIDLTGEYVYALSGSVLYQIAL